MKLPKNFGGKGFGNALQQAQQAMARAKNLETELESESVTIEKGGVTVVFTGKGEMRSISIDKDMIDPDDKEMLEDMIAAACKDAFTKANEIREEKVKDLMPDVPGMDQLGL